MASKNVTLKNKIDLVHQQDDDNHVVISITISSNHQPMDPNMLDTLMQQINSHIRLSTYKPFVKQPKSKKSKFKSENFV
jgi:hypothetical protein